MSWLRRSTRPATAGGAAETAPPGPEYYDTAAPGVAALLDGVSADGTHSILDLGPAAPSTFAVYSRFARRIRFADLAGQLGGPGGRRSVQQLLDGIPEQPGHPYDLVFGWDVLDRLVPEFHAPLINRLAGVAAASARLHVLARSADAGAVPPLRFTLLDTNRMRCEPAGPPLPSPARIMPARMAQLLAPFRVVHGFTLKGDLREYVALRQPG